MQHDFEVNVYEVNESLIIEWSYDCAKIPPCDSIRQLLENIKNKLGSIVEIISRE